MYVVFGINPNGQVVYVVARRRAKTQFTETNIKIKLLCLS